MEPQLCPHLVLGRFLVSDVAGITSIPDSFPLNAVKNNQKCLCNCQPSHPIPAAATERVELPPLKIHSSRHGKWCTGYLPSPLLPHAAKAPFRWAGSRMGKAAVCQRGWLPVPIGTQLGTASAGNYLNRRAVIARGSDFL